MLKGKKLYFLVNIKFVTQRDVLFLSTLLENVQGKKCIIVQSLHNYAVLTEKCFNNQNKNVMADKI